MAGNGRDQNEADEGIEAAPHSSGQLGRSALWACVALLTMSGAILAARSESGIRRIAMAWNQPETAIASIAPTGFPGGVDPALVRETRRLAATIESLAAERKQLVARLDSLERSVDVTGSVPTSDRSAKSASAPEAAALPQPPAQATTPTTTERAVPADAAPTPGKASGDSAARPPRSSEPAGPLEEIAHAAEKGSASPALADVGADAAVYRTDFGLDLGGAPTLDALRGLWLKLKVQHAGLFEGLRPLVAIRERGESMELRLVAGPLSNAAAAARLCVALADAPCKAVIFDGQRLALR